MRRPLCRVSLNQEDMEVIEIVCSCHQRDGEYHRTSHTRRNTLTLKEAVNGPNKRDMGINSENQGSLKIGQQPWRHVINVGDQRLGTVRLYYSSSFRY